MTRSPEWLSYRCLHCKGGRLERWGTMLRCAGCGDLYRLEELRRWATDRRKTPAGKITPRR